MNEKLNFGMKKISEHELAQVFGGANGSPNHVKIVNCDCCNVRSSPNTKNDCNIIGRAYPGEIYIFLNWTGRWARIQYGSSMAYVDRDFVQLL